MIGILSAHADSGWPLLVTLHGKHNAELLRLLEAEEAQAPSYSCSQLIQIKAQTICGMLMAVFHYS